MMRWFHLAMLLLPELLRAQGGCSTYFIGHPFGSCALGNIAISGCPTGFDSIVWSNGYQGLWATGLPPGSHSYMVHDNGQVVAADTFLVEQLQWSFSSVNMQPLGLGYAISGHVQVPWCHTSAYNDPCCDPDPASTYVRLVQDGTTEITTFPCIACDQVDCSGTTFMFQNVPPGHSYQVRLYDLSCGQVLTDTSTFQVPLTTGVVANEEACGPGDLTVHDGETLTLPGLNPASTVVSFFDGLGHRMVPPRLAPGRYLVSDLVPGIYFVQVRTGGTARTYRFLRQ